MPAPTLEQLRRSYWWGCKYLDSLYRVLLISGEKFGVISEYQTTTPISVAYNSGTVLQSGNGVIEDFFTDSPFLFIRCGGVIWAKFNEFYEVDQYVVPSTRDYFVAGKVGFECPTLYVTSAGSDYRAPLLVFEYGREHKIKNGSFIFRRFLSENVEEDLPEFWSVSSTNASVHLIPSNYTFIMPGPCPAPKASKLGPYSLMIEVLPGDGICSAEVSQLSYVMPDTQYLFSIWYVPIKTPYERFKIIIDGYDLEDNFQGELASDWIPADESCEWKHFELRFYVPPNVYKLKVRLCLLEGSRPPEGELWDVVFDAAYLVESYVPEPSANPRNLSIHNYAMLQIEDYKSSWGWSADIYFNGQKIWEAISESNIPRDVFTKTLPLEGLPSFRSAIRHGVQNLAFFYETTSMNAEWETRSGLLHHTRTSWGYTYDIYHPLFRASDGYPDGWWYDVATLHDCDAWYAEPRTSTFYPYWSKICLCKELAIGPIAYGYWLNPFFRALVAMHILNKYKDPFKSINIGGTLYYNPIEILLTGESNTGLVSIIDSIDPDLGWQFSGVYFPYSTSCCMAALAEIGYGFRQVLEAAGYGTEAQTARDYADRLALSLLKCQWGTPAFEPAGNFIHKHESFGEVCHPESAGGFLTGVVWQDGEALATARRDILTQFVDIYNMPMETPQFIPVNQETTFLCVRALQIYEWYKYKGGENKGVFPALLMPADVNGDGTVDVEDLKLVAQTIEKGEYYDFADINADGVVDIKDFNLVKQNLRTPLKGTFWWPKTSDQVTVSVS